VDPEERTRKEQERVIKGRERLKFRVFAAVRDVVLGTQLFRSNFQLHEPDICVNVYAEYVDVNTTLNEGQLRLLPTNGRSRDLNLFAEELQSGIGRVAGPLHLQLTLDTARYGGSEPVRLLEASCGYRAVLLRSETE
jgi:hypothetical protein